MTAYRNIALASFLPIMTVLSVAPASASPLLLLTWDDLDGSVSDVAGNSAVASVDDWADGSDVSFDPFFGPTATITSDFSSGYAEVGTSFAMFGYRWGFTGGFTLNTDVTVEMISFDYEVLGHNGLADLEVSVGSWTGNAAIAATTAPDPGTVKSGTISFSVGSLLLGSGFHSISLLATNTDATSGFWDANIDATAGASAYYRIDNFRVDEAVLAPIPLPASVGFLAVALAGLFGASRFGARARA